MQSWDAVRQAVGERFKIVNEGKTYITVANDDDGVEVTVSLAEVMSGALLVFAAPVDNPRSHEPAWALRHNAELAIGALAQTDKGCVVRQTAFGDSVSPDHLALTIDLIAEAAARLSADRVCPTTATVFAGYAE